MPCKKRQDKCFYYRFTNEEVENQNSCHLLKVTPLVSTRDQISNQVFGFQCSAVPSHYTYGIAES